HSPDGTCHGPHKDREPDQCQHSECTRPCTEIGRGERERHERQHGIHAEPLGSVRIDAIFSRRPASIKGMTRTRCGADATDGQYTVSEADITDQTRIPSGSRYVILAFSWLDS